jgi:2,4-dienoyl-CoA reductase (NADPH2)
MLDGGLAWDEITCRSPRPCRPPASASSAPISAGTKRRCRPSPPWCRARRSRRSRAGCASTCSVPVITSNRINMPDGGRGRAGARRRRPGVDGAADAGRPRAREQGRAGPRGRDQHLHRLQPGLPGPHLRRPPAGELPGQPARLQRDPAALPAGGGGQAHRGGRRRAGRAGRATVAAQRGHRSRCSTPAAEIGGQFNLAKRIPGKEEFHETLRYYRRMIDKLGITLRLNTASTPRCCAPRASTRWWWPPASSRAARAIDGIDHPKVVPYIDAILGRKAGRPARGHPGRRRHRLRRGRTGHACGPSAALDIDVFAREWGIDFENHPRGGVTGVQPQVAGPSAR